VQWSGLVVREQTYSVSTIAKLLILTERQVQALAKDGVLPKAERGRYALVPVVQAGSVATDGGGMVFCFMLPYRTKNPEGNEEGRVSFQCAGWSQFRYAEDPDRVVRAAVHKAGPGDRT
jgi:hypothetical protein